MAQRMTDRARRAPRSVDTCARPVAQAFVARVTASAARTLPRLSRAPAPGVVLLRSREPTTGSDSTSRPDQSATEARSRETRRLLERYRVHGDVTARDELVTRFMPLATQLARRYNSGSEPLED